MHVYSIFVCVPYVRDRSPFTCTHAYKDNMSNTRAPRHFDSGDVFAICSKHGYSEYVQKSWPIPKQSQDIIEMQTCSIFMRIVVLTTRSRSPHKAL